MQTFIDTVTSKVWQFEDGVIVTDTNGVYSFKTATGMPLSNTPTTLQPYTIPAPSYQELVSQAASTQSQMLISGYNTAINTPVQFKNSAGVTSSYKFGNTLTAAGTNAQALLTQIIAAGSAAWTAGIWFDVNNVAQTMTYSDLQGLMVAIEAMETPDEQQLMIKLAQLQAVQNIPSLNVTSTYSIGNQVVDQYGNVWTVTSGTSSNVVTVWPNNASSGEVMEFNGVEWTCNGTQVGLITAITW